MSLPLLLLLLHCRGTVVLFLLFRRIIDSGLIMSTVLDNNYIPRLIPSRIAALAQATLDNISEALNLTRKFINFRTKVFNFLAFAAELSGIGLLMLVESFNEVLVFL